MDRGLTNESVFDNTGKVPLRVPGFNGLPVDYQLPPTRRFAHGFADWSLMPPRTAREYAMVCAMNDITELPNWNVDIYNDAKLEDWHKHYSMKYNLLSEAAWTWCVSELKDKAHDYGSKNFVTVYEIGSCVCKSDTLVDASLHESIKHDVESLQDSYGCSNSALVDPLMYPLVFGETLALDTGQVDLDNPLVSYTHATKAPKHFDKRVDAQTVQREIARDDDRRSYVEVLEYQGQDYLWSYKFQALPCEAIFLQQSGTVLELSSYVNNLHPRHKSLYASIAKILSLAIEPWNSCLIPGFEAKLNSFDLTQRGRYPLRILTFGVEWENELPDWAIAFQCTGPARHEKNGRGTGALECQKTTYTQSVANIDESNIATGIPDVARGTTQPTEDLWSKAREYLDQFSKAGNDSVTSNWNVERPPAHIIFEQLVRKNRRLIKHKHPEPGCRFSYEDWKNRARSINRPVVDFVVKKAVNTFMHDFQPHAVRIEEQFLKDGLQAIIEITTMDLNTTRMKHNATRWQLAGQLNDHIVSVALYVVQARNITDVNVEFRQQNSLPQWAMPFGPKERPTDPQTDWHKPPHRYNKYHELAAISDVFGLHDDQLHGYETGAIPFQSLGKVRLPSNRLITFSNVIEHRISQFELLDKTRTGCLQLLKIYLVDPNYRTCSTRNVPPQQHNWWAMGIGAQLNPLPAEIRNQIFRETEFWPMSNKRALRIRNEMNEEYNWTQAARYTMATQSDFSA